MKDLGGEIGALEAAGGSAWGRAKDLYKAMWTDIDTTAGNYADQTLRQAVTAFKQELGADVLTDFFKKGVSFRGGLRNMSIDSVMTRVERDSDLLGKYFPKEDVRQMMTVLSRHAQNTPQIKTPGSSTIPNWEQNIDAFGPRQLAGLLSSPAGRQLIAIAAQHNISAISLGNAAAQAARAQYVPPSMPLSSPPSPDQPQPQ
jgi:hypothetical protein